MASRPLWTDEALTHLTTHFPAIDLLRYPLDPTAPLYFWLEQAFGGGETGRWAARWLSLLFGSLTVVPVALAGRELGGKWTMLGAGMAVALTPSLINYSHEGRAYALLLFLLAMAIWLALRAIGDEGRRRDLIGFWVAGVLALYTHLIALSVIAPLMLLLGVSWWRRCRPAGWPLAALAMALAFVPETNRLRLYHKKMHVFEWLQQPSPTDAVSTVLHAWTGLAGVLGLVVAAALIAVAWRYRPSDPYQLAVAGMVLASPLLTYLAGFLAPMLVERTVLPSALGFALVWGLAMRDASWRPPALVALFLLAVVGFLTGASDTPKEEWDKAAEAAVGRGMILACPRWQAAPLLAAMPDVQRPDVLIPAVRGVTLVPRGGHWADRLSTYQFRDEWAHHRKVERYPIRSVQVEGRSATLVTGQCSPDERRALENWFGPHSSRVLWKGRGVAGPGSLRVEEWTGPARRRPAILAVPGADVRRP
jgi:hypothetical protein